MNTETTNTEATRAQQRGATVKTAVDLKIRQGRLTQRRQGPPEVGDIFLSRRTAEVPVEWLVMETGDDGRLRVMPLDDFPFVGSRDLELPARSLGGAGVLRCDLGEWVEPDAFEPELRTGALSLPEMETVRRKQLAVEAWTPGGSLLEEVIDGDPEYRAWRDETLRPAMDALAGRTVSSGGDTAGSGAAANDDPASAPVIPWHHRWWPFLVAAILLIAILPTGWTFFRLDHQLGTERGRVAELTHERQILAEQLRASEAGEQSADNQAAGLILKLEEAEKAAAKALEEQEARLMKRLKGALEDRIVVNVPRFFLGQQARRVAQLGRYHVIDPGQVSRYTLSLEVVNPAYYPRYRLTILAKTGEEVWRTDQLIIDGSWLRLDLPAGFLEPGEYRLRIEGIGSGPDALLEERYTVKIR
ncbi:MAG: hypothetical protein AAF560_33315 [Acidobacteriota bacterium]